jgi:hypothetical protein
VESKPPSREVRAQVATAAIGGWRFEWRGGIHAEGGGRLYWRGLVTFCDEDDVDWAIVMERTVKNAKSKITTKQDFRRANLLVTRASRYEQSATRLPLHFPSTAKTLTACTPFQRVDVGVVACRRHIRGDGRARIQRAHSRLPFSARGLGFAKDGFFACQRAPRANTHANDTRV